MAGTNAGAQLTEAHRRAQARLGALTLLTLRNVWPLLRPEALVRTTPAWLAAAEPIVRLRRAQAASIAASYASAFRAVELGRVDSFTPAQAVDVDRGAVRRSLLATGPATVQANLSRGLDFTAAAARAEPTAAAAGMRHALNGARDTILGVVADDPDVKGWARVTSAGCCAFCATLSARGAVYTKAATVSFHAHDSCTCQPELVYRDDDRRPAAAQRFASIYNESTAGLSGRDAFNAFRRALAG